MRRSMLVFGGGVVGTIMRYGVFLHAPAFFNTWIVNSIGCFVFGYFSSRMISPSSKAFFITGFCGSFTTMSTLMSDVYIWVINESYGMLIGWIVVHLIVGILGLIFGKKVGGLM